MAALCAVHALSAQTAPKARTIFFLNPENCGPCRLEEGIESHLWGLLDLITTWRCSLTCRRRPPLSDAGLFLLAWLAVLWLLSEDEGCP